jgi:hypothetical protein
MAGSLAVFGFIRHGSADPHPDPDLRHNVLDPQHWLILHSVFLFFLFFLIFLAWDGDHYAELMPVTNTAPVRLLHVNLS